MENLRPADRICDSKAKIIVFLVESGALGIASENPAPCETLKAKPVRFHCKAPRRYALI
jgi:hypothetical protein